MLPASLLAGLCGRLIRVFRHVPIESGWLDECREIASLVEHGLVKSGGAR